MTKFTVRINDGAEQHVEVATGLYASAAVALPALLGIEGFPVRVSIWVAELQPDYPPLNYLIEEPGGRAKQLVRIVRDVAA